MSREDLAENVADTVEILNSRIRFLREALRQVRDDAECGAGLDSDNRKAFLENIHVTAENALLVTEDKE